MRPPRSDTPNACILCKFCKGRFGPDNTPRLAAKIKDRCARQTTRIRPIKTPEGASSRSMTPNSATTVATNSRAGRIGISVESKTVAPDRGYPLRTSKPHQRCPRMQNHLFDVIVCPTCDAATFAVGPRGISSQNRPCMPIFKQPEMAALLLSLRGLIPNALVQIHNFCMHTCSDHDYLRD